MTSPKYLFIFIKYWILSVWHHNNCPAKWQSTTVSVSQGGCNNDQMLSGLKQICYNSGGQMFQVGFTELNRAVFLLKTSKGESTFLLFPASRVYLHSLVHFPISSSAKSAVVSGVKRKWGLMLPLILCVIVTSILLFIYFF